MAIDFNKIKSIFIVDETTQNQTTEQTTEINKESTNQTNNTATTTTGNADKVILETLFKALADNNIQGFDYFEYKQSLKTLLGMLDEATAFKSAYATAATMGITKDKLVESANYYLKVLDKEKEKFTDVVQAQKSDNVKQKEDEIEFAKNTINTKSEQIRKLTDEISEAQAKINELQAFIINATDKITATVANFDASFNQISSEIKSDIQKINQHIN